MKREFPYIVAQASNWVATPLIIITSLLYIQQAVVRPAGEFFPVGLSVFGLTAALAGLCFTMTPSTRAEPTMAALRYAGEKFLHSSILLLQVLILVFVRDSLQDVAWIVSVKVLSGLITGTLQTLSVFLGSLAAWTWYWAFDQLNVELWLNWQYRIDDANRVTESTKEKSDGSSSSMMRKVPNDEKGSRNLLLAELLQDVAEFRKDQLLHGEADGVFGARS